jgi:hypothetical protein
MAYSRRNIATPLSRGGNTNALPSTKTTSYRNTILAILVLTSFYTAFLYQRGQSYTNALLFETECHASMSILALLLFSRLTTILENDTVPCNSHFLFFYSPKHTHTHTHTHRRRKYLFGSILGPDCKSSIGILQQNDCGRTKVGRDHMEHCRHQQQSL